MDMEQMPHEMEHTPRKAPSLGSILRGLDAQIHGKEGFAVFTEEVAGTQYEGRNDRIEHIRTGDPVLLLREPDNEANPENISVRNGAGASLGNLPKVVCSLLAPLMDAGMAEITAKVSEVVPLSKRGSRAKKAILKVEIRIAFGDRVQCTLCKLGGDQVNLWVQQLEVLRCDLPTSHAKLLFELYNRFSGEYDNLDQGENDTSYAGLDNLEEEIREAREKLQRDRIPGLDYSRGDFPEDEDFGAYVLANIASQPGRYGELARYEIGEYSRLDELLEDHCIWSETCYWIDQTRVSQGEFEEYDGFNHWYDILELYDGNAVPVDLEDADVVSIFGCHSFEAFADLSYGC